MLRENRPMRKALLAAFFILYMASADKTAAMEVVVHAHGHSPLPNLDGADSVGTPGRIFFTDEPVLFTVTITYVADGSPGAQRDLSRAFTFPTRDWFDSIEFRTTSRTDRVVVPTIPKVLRSGIEHQAPVAKRRTDKNFVLYDRETATAYFELLGLAPGSYELQGRFGKEPFQPDDRGWFSIRRGDEDVATARLFYRYRADKASKDFRQYETIMRELMTKYEPDNAGILVSIADWSVDRVPEEETVRLYREAKAMLEKKWRNARSNNSADAKLSRDRLRSDIDQLGVFEKVLPYYRLHRDEVRFGFTFVGGNRVYAWFSRKGGSPIDTIDNDRPGPPRNRQVE
jgi:hypothetical protein